MESVVPLFCRQRNKIKSKRMYQLALHKEMYGNRNVRCLNVIDWIAHKIISKLQE